MYYLFAFFGYVAACVAGMVIHGIVTSRHPDSIFRPNADYDWDDAEEKEPDNYVADQYGLEHKIHSTPFGDYFADSDGNVRRMENAGAFLARDDENSNYIQDKDNIYRKL